ncbi:MAG: cytochrome-c peroxidase [Myxococcales bacterium]|nr:cytochrome-c peroxidase [Myxococcales bacterium]
MMKNTIRRLSWLMLVFAIGCGDDSSSSSSTPTEPTTPEPEAPAAPRPLREVVGETFEALPANADLEMPKVLLGRALFHDRRLSGDETLSCATCHSLDHGGAEPRAVSTGIRGQQGPINAPTVLNSEHNFVQFWDGRAADLLEQAAGPVTNPIEMGGEWPIILERLTSDQALVAQMTQVYGENPVTQANVLDAIVQYERYLSTPSAFDRWLGGEDDALTEQQQRGLRTFVEVGCTTCHRGRNVGGGMYQRMGLVHDYFERRGGAQTEADNGRFNVTHEDTDRHMFKVPTLRNIELTAPYFHDGQENELAGAVRTMGYVQLDRELTDAQVDDIVAFLHSLTGELPADARIPGAEGETEGEAPAAAGGEAPAGETAAE